MEKYYVYKTTNKLNGRYYIGVHKSENIEKDSYLGSGYILAKAITKYGKENFQREILFEFDTPEEAFSMEKEIVNEEFVNDDITYNVALGGHGGKITEINPFVGRKHTEETKEILRRKSSEKRHTEESKQKISNSLNEHYASLTDEQWEEMSRKFSGENGPFFGRHHTEEVKEILRQKSTGRIYSEESRRKMSENSAMKGVPKSEEFKRFLSELYTGRECPWVQITNKNPEKIRKTAEKHRGMKRSEEACKNMSESLKGKYKGEDNHEFKGYWVTPYGKFNSLESAHKELGLCQATIHNRCLRINENKVITFSVNRDPRLSKDDIGKTWKELGWSFEPVVKE